MAFNEEFIDEISQVSPSNNVTDETLNTPLAELQHNVKFLANLLSNYSVSAQSGNLLNSNSTGTQTSQNGGTFNTFETKNSWLAVENNVVSNDAVIKSDLPIDALIWTGQPGTVQTSGVATTGTSGIIGNVPSWIEREFFIPPQLRGMELTFAIKGTGCITDNPFLVDGQIPYIETQLPGVYNLNAPITTNTTGTSATLSLARYEDLIIEVIGSNLTDPVVVTMGPWPNHKYFARNPLWKPEYRTQVISFTVPLSTSSIKIKIYRTLASGCVAFTNMFFGSIPKPFADWKFENIDINELYDFFNGLVKLHATTLLGHHLAQSKKDSLLSNVLTKQQVLHITQFNKVIEEYDWDQISGPRQVELDNENVSTPKISIFEF